MPTTKCPECGAALTVVSGQTSVVCASCGTAYQKREGHWRRVRSEPSVIVQTPEKTKPSCIHRITGLLMVLLVIGACVGMAVSFSVADEVASDVPADITDANIIAILCVWGIAEAMLGVIWMVTRPHA